MQVISLSSQRLIGHLSNKANNHLPIQQLFHVKLAYQNLEKAMSSHDEVDGFLRNNSIQNDYPKAKIIRIYGLLGGIIGSIFIILVGLIIMVFIGEISEVEHYFQALGIGALVIVVGFFLGLIPSLTTALIITMFKIYFDSVIKVLPIFIIGFMSTFLCVVWFTLDEYSMNAIVRTALLCCIGGLSAIVTGWIALPKHKHQ